MKSLTADVAKPRADTSMITFISLSNAVQVGFYRLSKFHWLLSWISPIALMIAWYAVSKAGWFPDQILVPPDVVWDAFNEIKDSGELQANLQISLFRLFTGFGLGVVSGLFFGVGLARSRTIQIYFGLLFDVLRQFPTLVLIPMFVLFFGIDEKLKIIIIVKSTFFPVAMATKEAVRNIPPQYLELGKVYKLRPVTWFTKLILPATLPSVLTGIRVALNRSWLILVAVELMAADIGIGQMMAMARQMLRLDIVMVGVILTGLIGFSLDKGIRLLERLVTYPQARDE
jgi:sulfonate transport system permease protein